ncbi:aspartate carbamoyltransferase [Paenibacillus sp. J31TS4]|uniref:aspartate carbamoyltransferase catalytic subunit n=1 Tax=Paenibacillus sp. J31TS4 TaxID=2807195 RepID=UPI001B2ACA8C|nr:aspartate carbamoyltransferase catalytic subunit [Paenibacillus sp. J31TS4]GIP39701.1 aspartate carbamoyltransferase [Paenibacillus sp. J31TS4]
MQLKTLEQRHLLGLKDKSASEITELLDRAAYWEQSGNKLDPWFQGFFVANMFFENSTRTRFSFEVAEKRLGVQVLNFAAAVSSVQKGESIYDTVKTLEAMGIHAGVIRMKPNGLLQHLAEHVKIPLINAGDGSNEHPTQALLDLYTMRKHFGHLRGLKVSIIGDISHSRVARSNLWALRTMGASVQLCAPESMRATELAEFAPYVTMDEALNADVVMMLRVQLERHEEKAFSTPEQYRSSYGLTVERERKLKDHAIIMHPAPINRGVEIDDELVEHPRSKIFAQMGHGVPVRMAVMERALS